MTRFILRRAATLDAHHQVALALIAAIAVSFATSGRLHTATQAIVTWNVFAIFTLVLAWNTIFNADVSHIQRVAQTQDFGRTILFLIVVTAASVSLLTVGLMLGPAKNIPETHSGMHLFQSTVAVITSWLLPHTAYTLRYAHLFYVTGPRPPSGRPGAGLSFPGKPTPDYLDFAYFAFVIGMTCQVSDVQVTSRRMRKLVLVHSILSFAFNTLILALSVSVISQMLQRTA